MFIALIMLNDLVELQAFHTLQVYDSQISHASNPLPGSLSIHQPRAIKFESRPDGDLVIKADFEAYKIQDSDVTIILRTTDKPICLYNLVASIKKQYFPMRIIIADDGNVDASGAVSSLTSNVFFFRLPFDSGVSAARNLMISQVQSKYVLLLNDDFLWDQTILNHFIHVMQLHPHLDMVGGRADKEYAGILHLENETLYLVEGNRGILEGTALPILLPRDPRIDYPEPVFSDMGPPCVLVDFVPHFFLARTESLLKLQWDTNLKSGEEEEFFLRFNQGNFRAAYCTALQVNKQQEKCHIQGESDINAGRKELQRTTRALEFTRKGLTMHNISKLAYCLQDRSISLPSWSPIDTPFPEHPCVVVPLPETCPIGKTGINCDRCATGFSEPDCNKCLPNHFGLHCIPCQCSEHGTCEVHEDKTDHVSWCKCEPNWFGANCELHLKLGSNQVRDPDLTSLMKKDPSRKEEDSWHIYRDGCARVAENGVWLMNDGSKVCGALYKIDLHQGEPLDIVVSAKSKGVGIAPFKDPHKYSVMLDLLYDDGTESNGHILSFPHGTHSLHFKEILVKPEKPVKNVAVYVTLQTSGNAFFREISVRQQMKQQAENKSPILGKLKQLRQF